MDTFIFLSLSTISMKPDSGGGDGGAAPAETPTAPPASSDGGDKGGDKGGDPAVDSAKSIRQSIKDTSSEISKRTQKDAKSRHLGYGFEEEEPEPTPEPADSGEPDEGDDPTPDPEDPIEAEGNEGEGDDPDSGEPADSGEPEPSEPGDFYDPETHAKDKPVYPNKYKTRQDAEFAIAAKIEKFDELASNLEELGNGIGAAVPADIKEKIQSYRDVSSLGDIDDDEVRSFVAELDMSLKAASEKHDRVEKKVKTSKASSEVQKSLEKYQAKASEFAKEVGLDKRITAELGPDAGFEDVMSMAEEQIEATLEPLEKAVKEHEDNKKFIDDHGHKAYLAKLRELEGAYNERKSELQERKQDLVEWNNARVKAETHEKTTKQPTEAERLKQMDQTFMSWQEDRSDGPFALDIFKAPTTDPVKHFRKYALAPANRQKFDLTTSDGWDQAHKAWKTEMDKRFAQQKSQQDKDKKRTSDKTEPIPEPDKRKTAAPAGSPFNEMRRLQDSIKKNAKSMFS